MRRRTIGHQRSRSGAVTVEFAIIAPVLLVLVLGVVEAARLFEMQNLLASAAREGARMAAMDREGLVGDGQTTNEKVGNDVKNFLKAQGYDPEDIDVLILHADDDTPFDLDDSENDLELFRLRIEIPYDYGSSYLPGEDYSLGTEVTFRNGRALN